MSAAYHINGPNFYGFAPDDGSPLAGGKLYTYEPGTTTLRATYTTEAADVENTNPVILNSAGYAAVHLAGVYRLKLLDANDVLVWDEDPVTQANIPDIYDIDTYALDTGAADAYVVTLASWAVLTDGAGLWFKADNDNTGASTINVTNLGVTPIKKKYNLPLEAGDIKDGGIYHVRYDGVNFQMLEPMGVTASAAEINRLDGVSLTDDIITLEQFTKTLWYQDVAPNGWEIVAAVDDHAVSLTKGSVLTGIEGGTATGANIFSDQFADHAEDAALGVANHTLDATEIPAHTHGNSGSHTHSVQMKDTGGATGSTSNYLDSGATNFSDSGSNTINTVMNIASTHEHTSVGGSQGHAHTIDLDVARAHCIIAKLL